MQESKTGLERDENGVVRIEAASAVEAMRGLGRAHATDRGLQMLLMRILGLGRAAECLDPGDATVAIDRFFRKMNWSGGVAEEIPRLSARAREHCEAYCEGVNAVFARKGAPWELKLLGYRPEPWTPGHCILISRMVGYLTLAQSQAEMERLLVEMVQAGVSRAKLEELLPGLLEGLDVELLKQVRLGERIVPDVLKWGSPAPRLMASNNWVVSGGRTASGHPILANDPHLEANRLPNVWYEAVVDTGSAYGAGATMPGLPAILIGRNHDLAWGATYTFMDSVDSWVERCRDGKYLRLDASGRETWQPFRKRVETIRRKKGAPIEVIFHENEHGTLDGDPAVEGAYLTTRWSGAQSGARSLEAMTALWEARTVEDGRRILGEVEVSFNWVFADRQGNIGYQMSGLMPKRKAGWKGVVPLPGWKPENDWQGFVAAADLPRSLNPADGIFVTANDDLNRFGREAPITLPMGPDRANRIRALLSAKPRLTAADCMKMHFDVHSTQAEAFLAILRPLLPDTEAGKLLATWDCGYDPDSRGASAFEDFYRELQAEVFGRGFGEGVVQHLLGETGTFVDFYLFFDRVLLSDRSEWFGGESREAIYRRVAERSLRAAPERWGNRQKLPLSHLVFGGKLPRWLGFDRGPIEIRGGRATVHQGQIYRSAGRLTSFIPSFRMIAELDRDGLRTNLVGGPSDRRFSKWYCNDVPRWLAGDYKPVGPRPKGAEASVRNGRGAPLGPRGAPSSGDARPGPEAPPA